MATMLNLSERQYRRIEKNDCKPDIWSAIRIADALGVQDLRELWKRKEVET
ncbi:MAG: helix-turn-helix transcriptional regulator [Selenomonadaceae bacterium]|nr:helix-turn-helix transcriptional regulator [Selenomonadaceae bacterium]